MVRFNNHALEFKVLTVKKKDRVSFPYIGVRHGGQGDIELNTVEYLNRVSRNQSSGPSQKLNRPKQVKDVEH
ncbi:hypothetical protein SCA6_009343 [Theobroma cacao]